MPDFSSLGLAPALLSVLPEIGYAEPTPVQAACIPELLAGRDVIAQSRTGSGKTAAFALPLLQGVALDERRLQALVICPTRELSTQVAREIRTLGRGLPGLAVVELVGGRVAWEQRKALQRGAHVAVGTPGRLLDLIASRSLDLSNVVTLVLDEADRMLDMGFGPDVETVLEALPTARRTALFSATIPASIEAMSAACQREPLRVEIETPEDDEDAIRELRLDVAPEHRFDALCRILHDFPHESALIFCNYKVSVTELVERLSAAGAAVDRLDGDMEQFFRDQVLARFRNGSLRLLVTTDVLGRGIDIEGLDLVVNFELPSRPEVYLHRIGRTGRAGQTGVAVSITTHGRDARLRAIEERTGRAIEDIEFTDGAEQGELLRAVGRGAPMRTIMISGGRKDKVRRGDILGALTGEAGGLQGAQVGKIEVQDRLSYVAVARDVARTAVERLNAGRIKGKRFRATLVGKRRRPDRGRPRGRPPRR